MSLAFLKLICRLGSVEQLEDYMNHNLKSMSLYEFTVTPRVAITRTHTRDQRPETNSFKLINSLNRKFMVLKLGVERT